MIADTRARIPFALLGVLLLVSSLTLAPTFVSEPTPTDTAVERALDSATADTQIAVRDGVSTAGRRAAANPVITPADTAAGRVLNESSPFRDSLRIRVYLQVQDRLEEVSSRSDDVTVSASLPPVGSATDLRAAKRRVSVSRAGANRTAMRATVENITLTVRRNGQVVDHRRISPTVVVPTQALMLHDQVSTYETRLNNGLADPGLSQRMTARLYPMAWARGYAQYGGAGIENVIANRHVSLATNGALLGVQRSTFGRSDPDGRRALTEATAMTGLEDLVRGSQGTAYASEVLDHAEYRPMSERPARLKQPETQHGPNRTMHIGVNETADEAFRTVTDPEILDQTLADAYTVEVALETEDRRISGGRPARPPSPGANWTLVREETTQSTQTVGDATGTLAAPDGWHTLQTFSREVERTHRRSAVWQHDGNRRRTASSSTERRKVTVAVVGRHQGDSPAPDRPISTAHDAGSGPLNGSNLADIEGKAASKLVDEAGGRDAVAKRAVENELQRTHTTVQADRPPGLQQWVYRDLMTLRESVRNTSVTAAGGEVGTFETNPPRELRGRLDEQRDELADVPESYDSTAQKARVAARIAYLDEVDDSLAAQAAARDGSREQVDSELIERTDGSLRDLRRGLTASRTDVPPSRPTPTGPAGPVRTRVDARPPYLTRAELDEQRYPAIEGTEHPLVARNVNVFTVPYGDAAEGIVSRVTPPERTRLSTAAATLAGADETAQNEPDATLDAERARLREEVTIANQVRISHFKRTVQAETDAGPETSEQIVHDAMAPWDRPAARGLALTNGSAPERVATIAGERRKLSRVEQDRLRLALIATLEEPAYQPTQQTTNQTASATRAVARDVTTDALADAGKSGAERLAKKRLGTDRLPSGLPLAPPVTPWYATTNIWWVTVEGEYARFAVTASHGDPSTPAAQTTYSRDGDTVKLDIDADGQPERLGTADRVSFSADTGVVVVVPPKPRGVGDKDGNANEESSGWPDAGA